MAQLVNDPLNAWNRDALQQLMNNPLSQQTTDAYKNALGQLGDRGAIGVAPIPNGNTSLNEAQGIDWRIQWDISPTAPNQFFQEYTNNFSKEREVNRLFKQLKSVVEGRKPGYGPDLRRLFKKMSQKAV